MCLKEQKQKISCWVDGECSPEEAQQCMAAIADDAQLLAYWKCCHAMKDAALGRYAKVDTESLCIRVQHSLEDLPKHSVADKKSLSPFREISFSRNKKKTWRWTQMAIAASVVAFVLIMVDTSPVTTLPQSPQVAINKNTPTIPFSSSLVKRSHLPDKQRVVLSVMDEPLATLDNRIFVDSDGNMYLVGHHSGDVQHKRLLQRNALIPYIEKVDY